MKGQIEKTPELKKKKFNNCINALGSQLNISRKERERENMKRSKFDKNSIE